MVAAVAGGGLKAAGMEVPVVSSVLRQVLLASIGIGLAVLSFTVLGEPRATAKENSSVGADRATETGNVPQPVIATGVLVRRVISIAPDGSRTETIDFYNEQLARAAIRQDSVGIGSASEVRDE